MDGNNNTWGNGSGGVNYSFVTTDTSNTNVGTLFHTTNFGIVGVDFYQFGQRFIDISDEYRFEFSENGSRLTIATEKPLEIQIADWFGNILADGTASPSEPFFFADDEPLSGFLKIDVPYPEPTGYTINLQPYSNEAVAVDFGNPPILLSDKNLYDEHDTWQNLFPTEIPTEVHDASGTDTSTSNRPQISLGEHEGKVGYQYYQRPQTFSDHEDWFQIENLNQQTVLELTTDQPLQVSILDWLDNVIVSEQISSSDPLIYNFEAEHYGYVKVEQPNLILTNYKLTLTESSPSTPASFLYLDLGQEIDQTLTNDMFGLSDDVSLTTTLSACRLITGDIGIDGFQ